jgi:hypothetical protein
LTAGRATLSDEKVEKKFGYLTADQRQADQTQFSPAKGECAE